MFFSKPGIYKACGIFSLKHFILLFITILGIFTVIKNTKVTSKEDIKKIITKATIFAWVLEIIKIIFNLSIGNGNNINTYVPLYYCSILLYAGILSSLCKNKLKRIGDVFLATGGIVAGIVFILYPSTSLRTYPLFHYISIQSFIYHGIMIYLGIIINKYEYIKITRKDFIYYCFLIMFVGFIALIFNNIFGSNLMFISHDFPNTPISILYKYTGSFFPVIMVLIQATAPFDVIRFIINKIQEHKSCNEQENIELLT